MASKTNPFAFLQQVRSEASKITWPSQRETMISTAMVLVMVVLAALFFFAGVHEDYHRPSDEVEAIDGDKASRVARLIFHTSHTIADTTARPTWTEEGLAEIRALTGGGR